MAKKVATETVFSVKKYQAADNKLKTVKRRNSSWAVKSFITGWDKDKFFKTFPKEKYKGIDLNEVWAEIKEKAAKLKKACTVKVEVETK